MAGTLLGLAARKARTETDQDAGSGTWGRWRSPLVVAAVVWAVYGAMVVSLLGNGADPRDFSHLGTSFLERAHSSQVIRIDPSYHGYETIGYDGEFFYYIALDPLGARPYIDAPAYRYTRILYPMLARLLALGRPGLVPYTLILVNWLAAGLGTLAVAAWLRRRRVSPWYALAFGLFPGVLISLSHDLSEVLAYALAAVAVLLFDSERRGVRLAAGLVFGAATLTRETVVVYPAVFLAMELLRGPGAGLADRARSNWPRALAFGVLSLGPLLAWKGVLHALLGSWGLEADRPFDPLPLHALAHAILNPAASPGWDDSLRSVAVPSLVVLGLVLHAWWRLGPFAMGWLYVLNCLPFVVFLGPNSWDGVSGPRIATGVVLAGVLCLPQLLLLGSRVRAAFWAAAALWLSSMPVDLLVPALQYARTLKQDLLPHL